MTVDWISQSITVHTEKGERAIAIQFMSHGWTVRVPPEVMDEDLQAWAQSYVLGKLVQIVADNKEDIK